MKTREDILRKLEIALVIGEIKPDDVFGQWKNLIDDGYFQESLVYIEKYLDLAPEDDRGFCAHAQTLDELDRHAEALKSWKIAVQMDPLCASYHHGMATCLHTQGRYEEAMIHHQYALQIAPDEPTIHVGISHTLAETNKPEAALKHMLTATKMEPENPHHHLNLAWIYSNMNNSQKALEHGLTAYKFNPDDYFVCMCLAQTYQDLEKPNQAIYFYMRAIELGDDDADNKEELVNLLEQQGRYDEAKRYRDDINPWSLNYDF